MSSDFRIIDSRSSSCGGGGCEDCSCSSGGCGSADTSVEGEPVFKPGTIVKSKLTGDSVMILKAELDNPFSYIVRTKAYEMVRLFDFEIE